MKNYCKWILIIIILIIISTYVFMSIKNKNKNGDFIPRKTDNNTSVLYIILNMEKNKDRLANIENKFVDLKEKYNCDYLRIEAVDGHTMENDPFVKKILKPDKNLLGEKFRCISSNEEWIYDGKISQSFPGLKKNGHFGTKGLTLTNMKAFFLIKDMPKYDWYCILEDDSEINEHIYNKIEDIAAYHKSTTDIILLDKRGRGGACALLYSQKSINNLITYLHPLSYFSRENETMYKRGANLWDWKLWVFLDNYNIKHKEYLIVSSGKFKSTISFLS